MRSEVLSMSNKVQDCVCIVCLWDFIVLQSKVTGMYMLQQWILQGETLPNVKVPYGHQTFNIQPIFYPNHVSCMVLMMEVFL